MRPDASERNTSVPEEYLKGIILPTDPATDTLMHCLTANHLRQADRNRDAGNPRRTDSPLDSVCAHDSMKAGSCATIWQQDTSLAPARQRWPPTSMARFTRQGCHIRHMATAHEREPDFVPQ